MDLSLAFYITASTAILLTGLSKSGFGGGLGVMAVPLMSLSVTPQFAAAVMMPILLAMDILIVVRFRKNWNRQIVWALLPGALLGLVLGAISFQAMNADAIRFVVGLLALVFVAQFLLQGRRLARANPPKAAVAALGLVSGFASYVAHAGGPPVKGYLLSQDLHKTDFVGTNTVYFFVLNALKTVAYGSVGVMGVESLSVSLALTPLLFVGVGLGLWLHSRVDQKLFVKIVYAFLTLTALRLLSDSVPSLFFT